MFEAFAISTGVVALAEIGDKTQLLAFLLAARYRQPWPIVWGILIATIANHALAGALGQLVTELAPAGALRWILGLGFLGMAIWILIPDKIDVEEEQKALGKAGRGVFVATLIAFFLAEMGDKTQIATAALAARHAELVAVVLGSTLGMMIANVPAVFLGEKAAKALPLKLVRGGAAILFVVIGLATLFGLGEGLGI